MSKNTSYKVENGKYFDFKNNVDYCIGTGRLDLAMRKEYYDQLKLVQDEIGFSHIRGHGLFCDQMAIYHEYKDKDGNIFTEYNFTYLDLTIDNFIELNIKPFIELGFMPEKLASGTQTIFYWHGNTTPPKDYDKWCDLVIATLSHLMQRYGKDEVVSWPIEVWNEPNLRGFWKDADMDEYFKLFDKTFHAIKNFDKRFRVGGPAVCGGSDEIWIKAFLDYCSNNKLDIDFVTRHHYTTELPERSGHYGYAQLSIPEDGFNNLKTTRDIIDSFEEYKGLEIHITEFNTSYIPNCPLHDTNLNAAYIAYQLSRLGEVNESYSYWTFGDIFEEQGIPFTPFHGGFGLVADGCIPKPTFWTFKFFKDIKNGKCVLKSDNAVVVENDNKYKGVLWNMCMDSNAQDELEINIDMSVLDKDKRYCLITKIVDEETCNPLKVWHNMGEPSSLSPEKEKLLRECARPFIDSKIISFENDNNISFSLSRNSVIYFEIEMINDHTDLGFSYDRIKQMY